MNFLSLFLLIETGLQLLIVITGFLTPIGLLGSAIAFSIGEFFRPELSSVLQILNFT